MAYSLKFRRWISLIQEMKKKATDPVYFPAKMLTKRLAVEKQFDSANYRTAMIRIDNSELRIRFAKDFAPPVKSSLNKTDWQTVFTKDYWDNQIEKLANRHFFIPSIFDIVFGLTSIAMFLGSCLNFCLNRRSLKKLKKVQQKQDIRLFKIRERENIRNMERRDRSASPEPLLPPPPTIIETRPIIEPMYSRPGATIVDIGYPTTLPPQPRRKRNRNRRKNRPDPPAVLARAVQRSNTEEPLYRSQSYFSLDEQEN
jgi:hypothetical protein